MSLPLLCQASLPIRETIPFRLRRSWPGRFHRDTESKGFSANALVRACNQTGGKCSDDRATEATSAGLIASKALHVKLWTAEAWACKRAASPFFLFNAVHPRWNANIHQHP
jgi:hypothetical protein